MFPSLKCGEESNELGPAFMTDRKINQLINDKIVYSNSSADEIYSYYKNLKYEIKQIIKNNREHKNSLKQQYQKVNVTKNLRKRYLKQLNKNMIN